jgi:NADH:ubiquinone oxidoreductase subunit 6 (subunit J)
MQEETKTKNTDIFKNLRNWNAIMGILHLMQGIAMWLLSKELVRDIVWNLPKPTVPTQEMIQRGQRAMIVFENEKWFSINLGQTIAIFLFLSAFAHLFTILPKIYPWYLKNIKKEINYIRWYEYALSSSLMIFVIAMLTNINNAAILIPIVAINACMNLFGASMEMHNSTLKELEKENYKTNWLHFWYGCFAGIIPWVVMGVYFFTSLNRLSSIETLPNQVRDILNLVRFIFPALFVFFNLFAINMFLQYKRWGAWKNYLFGEKVYILLSLFAKSFLAWFIWGGTLR